MVDKINLYNACSYKHDGSRDTCMSDTFIEKLRAQGNNLNLNSVLDKILAEKKGKTVDELGLLLDKRVISALGEKEVLKELHTSFKPLGPVNNDLFNNFVEDNVMKHLEHYDPTFLGLDVNLMDFLHYGGSITKLKPAIIFKGKQYKHFGCVMNTMNMSGDLTKVGHWVALYGDFRNPNLHTIEYFNSSGRSAPPELYRWMEQFAKECEISTGIKCIPVNVSNIQHQKSDTECGIYAVYFITARIIGISYKKFREVAISDDRVNKFRKNMFNDQKAVANRSFLESNRLI